MFIHKSISELVEQKIDYYDRLSMQNLWCSGLHCKKQPRYRIKYKSDSPLTNRTLDFCGFHVWLCHLETDFRIETPEW